MDVTAHRHRASNGLYIAFLDQDGFDLYAPPEKKNKGVTPFCFLFYKKEKEKENKVKNDTISHSCLSSTSDRCSHLFTFSIQPSILSWVAIIAPRSFFRFRRPSCVLLCPVTRLTVLMSHFHRSSKAKA